jgi:hypothetical protein
VKKDGEVLWNSARKKDGEVLQNSVLGEDGMEEWRNGGMEENDKWGGEEERYGDTTPGRVYLSRQKAVTPSAQPLR